VIWHWCALLEAFIIKKMWLLSKLRFSSLRHRWILRIVAILFKAFGSLLPNTFNLFCFQYFEIESIWFKLFQKYDVSTKFDIYLLLLSLGRYLCWWTISPRGYHPSSSQCYYHWVDSSAGGILVPEGVIRPVVSAAALTWFTRYIFHW
jgi:hypothetical protein